MKKPIIIIMIVSLLVMGGCHQQDTPPITYDLTNDTTPAVNPDSIIYWEGKELTTESP